MRSDFEWLKWVGFFLVISILVAVYFVKNTKSKEVGSIINSLMPSSLITQNNLEFVNNYFPQIQEQCPGLGKYKEDWVFDQVGSRGFTIKVAEKPQNDKLWEYRATSNRCFFDLSDDSSSVSIPKRACASLCKDQLIDDSSFKIHVTAIKGKNDSSLLTEQERTNISSSLGAMMVWLGTPEENDKIVEKLANTADKEELDKYLLDKYLKAKADIEVKATAGDYQSQRNTAYMFSNDSEKLGGNKKFGCAWYLILFASGDPKVQSGSDKSNIDNYCGHDYLNDAEREEAFELAKAATQHIYKSVDNFNKTYGVN